MNLVQFSHGTLVADGDFGKRVNDPLAVSDPHHDDLVNPLARAGAPVDEAPHPNDDQNAYGSGEENHPTETFTLPEQATLNAGEVGRVVDSIENGDPSPVVIPESANDTKAQETVQAAATDPAKAEAEAETKPSTKKGGK